MILHKISTAKVLLQYRSVSANALPLLFITNIPFVMHCYGEQNVWFFEIQQATANINKLSWKVDCSQYSETFVLV